MPATLVLFFIRDRLQAAGLGAAVPGELLRRRGAVDSAVGAAVARFGLARSWLAGMVLAIAVFAWAALLGAGDIAAYTVVCVLSGMALGADLTLPGALLAGVIQRAGHAGRARGRLLRLVELRHQAQPGAGRRLALPLLQAFGYAPGGRDDAGAEALTLAYCAAALRAQARRRGAAVHSPWLRPVETPTMNRRLLSLPRWLPAHSA